MYRDKLNEIKKAKGYTNKMISERTPSHIAVDTINRALCKTSEEDPRLDTLEEICIALEVEIWEIFFIGDTSFVSAQAEIMSLKAERDVLVAENAVLKDKVETLRDKNDALKDEIIATHNYYIKRKGE